MPASERKEAYGSDVLYATNNELGFDYLRDNMAHQSSSLVQRPFNYGIVDEVDSILIDEARTPLIISGASSDSSALYRAVDPVIARLGAQDYEKDEKMRSVSLTDEGTEHVEEWLREAQLLEGGLYDVGNISIVHHVQQALRARTMFQRDVDYIVREGRVVIIDEFTGRMMEGRTLFRWLAPSHRSQRECRSAGGKSDAGEHYLPELFSLVSQVGGDDGHGDDGACRVFCHL